MIIYANSMTINEYLCLYRKKWIIDDCWHNSSALCLFSLLHARFRCHHAIFHRHRVFVYTRISVSLYCFICWWRREFFFQEYNWSVAAPKILSLTSVKCVAKSVNLIFVKRFRITFSVCCSYKCIHCSNNWNAFGGKKNSTQRTSCQCVDVIYFVEAIETVTKKYWGLIPHISNTLFTLFEMKTRTLSRTHLACVCVRCNTPLSNHPHVNNCLACAFPYHFYTTKTDVERLDLIQWNYCLTAIAMIDFIIIDIRPGGSQCLQTSHSDTYLIKQKTVQKLIRGRYKSVIRVCCRKSTIQFNPDKLICMANAQTTDIQHANKYIYRLNSRFLLWPAAKFINSVLPHTLDAAKYFINNTWLCIFSLPFLFFS